MSERFFFLVTAVVFAVVGGSHLLRIAFGWDATIAGWSVPIWVSWVAAAVTVALASLGVGLFLKAK